MLGPITIRPVLKTSERGAHIFLVLNCLVFVLLLAIFLGLVLKA